MQYFNTMHFKVLFLTFLSMVIGSFKANAFKMPEELPLPMAFNNNGSMVETREFLLTGDGILLIGFLLWIAYVVLRFPKDTLKKS